MSRPTTIDRPIGPIPDPRLQTMLRNLEAQDVATVRRILREEIPDVRFIDQVNPDGTFTLNTDGTIRQVPIGRASKRALIAFIGTYADRQREAQERTQMGDEDILSRRREIFDIASQPRQGLPPPPEKVGPLRVRMIEHPLYAKYARFKKMNLPPPVLMRKMMEDGMSADEAFRISQLTSEDLIEVPPEYEEQARQMMQDRLQREKEAKEEAEALQKKQMEEAMQKLLEESKTKGAVNLDELREAMKKIRVDVAGDEEGDEGDGGAEETKGSGIKYYKKGRRKTCTCRFRR